MTGGPGGLSFVFTDIEGSTRLVNELKTGYGLALRVCRRLLVNTFEPFGGREFGNEGDGQFFVFPTPAAAATAAVEAQRRMASADLPGAGGFRVRIGVHCGPVRLSGGEYVGLTIHEVARICAAAHGGQVLCSEVVARAVRRESADLEVVDLGRYTLRGLAGGRSLFEVLAAGLEHEAAPLREAVREGGRRATVWHRGPAADGLTPSPADLDWTPLAAGVEVAIYRRDDDGTEVLRITVTKDGTVEEEYDGLTIGGACDAATLVNGTSRLIKLA